MDTETARNAGIEAEFEDLLQFLYLMPVGVVRFADDGTIAMLNPMASQLLTPLLPPRAGLDNLFTALDRHCPELAEAVAGFDEPAGTILDQRRIHAPNGRRHLILSLTVTRVRPGVQMAVVKDITRLSEMLAYTFASADLLIDADADGIIGWAGGAFRQLLGIDAAEAVGRPLAALIAPADRTAFARAITLIGACGRIAPLILRLANGTQSRCVLSGLSFGGTQRRLFVTVGPLPISHLPSDSELLSAREFEIEVKEWMRAGHAGLLDLLDIAAWQPATSRLSSAEMQDLRRRIGALTGRGGRAASMIGEMGGGRFGIVGQTEGDLERLRGALAELVGGIDPAAPQQVAHTRVELDPGALTLGESMQAMRLLLSRFEAKGMQGVLASGAADGVAGMLHEAGRLKRVLAAMIARGDFQLVFQPIVGLADRRLHHYEALLRPGRDPDLPDMNTQEFITLAEAVGLSKELDIAVVARVAAEARGAAAPAAVNVSGLSIADDAFVQALLAQLASVPRGSLLVELTETAEILNLAAAAANIERIRTAGVQVCLDDFGAGSASFRYVRDLHVDFVKIDGTYVRGAARSEQGQGFVRAMCDLARSAGATAIAEMIETEAEAGLMRDLGVALGQGWLFGKPAPLTQAARTWRY